MSKSPTIAEIDAYIARHEKWIGHHQHDIATANRNIEHHRQQVAQLEQQRADLELRERAPFPTEFAESVSRVYSTSVLSPEQFAALPESLKNAMRARMRAQPLAVEPQRGVSMPAHQHAKYPAVSNVSGANDYTDGIADPGETLREYAIPARLDHNQP